MKRLFTCLGLFSFALSIHAQVGIGTTTPDGSAQLEIVAVNRGVLIPRISSFNIPLSPAKGLLIYVTNGSSPGFNYYDGAQWKQLAPCIIGKNKSVFLGYDIGLSNSGSDNTAMGNGALTPNSTGWNNTAIGSLALNVNASGNDNTGIGYGALFVNTSGKNNTGIGSQALSSNINGNDNTAIGYLAGPSSGNLVNTTAVGSGATTTANNSVVLGNTSVTAIGGYAPYLRLSDVRFKTNIQPERHGLDFIMKLAPIMYNLNMNKLNNFIYEKKADSLMRLASFREGVEKKERILYSGFSAQQVEEAAQSVNYDFSAVHKPDNENDHYSLDYAAFVVPLVKAVQEQQQMIERLLKEKNQYNDEIKLLKEKVARIIKKEKKNEKALKRLEFNIEKNKH